MRSNVAFQQFFVRGLFLEAQVAGISLGPDRLDEGERPGFLLGQADVSWALSLVVATTILCGLFSKAGSGAVFAMVPLIQRRMTGQIAGMTGAYGNVGGVIFLTVLSFVSSQACFLFIAACGAVVLGFILLFRREPTGQMAEVQPDGTVQMIDVS